MIRNLIPYVSFDGEAADAIAHYQRALGAEVAELMRFADMKDHPFGPDANERVMHAMLTVGGASLMLSDIPPGTGLERGRGMNIVIELDDVAELRTRFDALAEGGEVTMPLHDAFWGATFGTLTDRFGVRWMLTGPRSS